MPDDSNARYRYHVYLQFLFLYFLLYLSVRVPSPTGDSTHVVGMRGRGQGSAVAVAARWSRGGERTTATRWNSRLLKEAGNKSLISLPLFRRGDYIFIVIGLYQ
jgi:hypothetical protein